MPIKKTVIGSFPKLPLEVDEAMKAVVDLQLRNGVGMVSDGEQRSDMITYFEQIPGLVAGPRGLMVNSRITSLEDPSDFIKVKDFIFVKDYLREHGRGDVSIKTTITGPITLGVTCAAAGLRYYSGLNDEKLYRDLSEALEPVVVRLLELGSFVQLDEPGLSAGYLAPSRALPILRDLFSRISSAKKTTGSLSIHVCGNLGKFPELLEELLEFNLDVVSLAFSGPTERQNVNLLREDIFSSSERKLGVGCIAVSLSRKEDVEDIEHVYHRIKRISEKVGTSNIAYAHPDCGLRNTPLEVSELILQRLSQAVDQYNLELSA